MKKYQPFGAGRLQTVKIRLNFSGGNELTTGMQKCLLQNNKANIKVFSKVVWGS
jgi:hypothetical protein